MAVILQPRLDQNALSEQLKKVEQEQNSQKQKTVDREKQSLDLTNRKLQLENRINELYSKRLRLVQQIENKEANLLQKTMARAKLQVNNAQSLFADRAYSNVVESANGGISGTKMTAADIAGVEAGTAIGNRSFIKRAALERKMMNSLLETFRNNKPLARSAVAEFGNAESAAGFLTANAFTEMRMHGASSFSKAAYRTGFRLGGILPRVPFGLGRLGGYFALGALGNEAFSGAGSTYEGARAIGMNTDRYQRYSEGFKRSGIGSMDEVYGSFLGARNKALSGDANARVAFNQLGVSNLKDANASFDQLIESMKKLGSNANNSRAALEIFGESTNRIVNGMSKFTEIFNSLSTMPEETIKSLVYVKDTFSTTVKEVANGVGILLAALKPVASLFNKGKGLIAAGATYAGARFGGASHADAQNMAQAKYHQYLSAQNPVTPEPFHTDVNANAGLRPIYVEPTHPHLGTMQRMGLYNGGAPVSLAGATVRDPIPLLKRIATATEDTAKKGKL